MSTTKDVLSAVSIWSGAVVGVLTVVDWLLSEAQKKRVQGGIETAWLWLAEQRISRIVLFLNDKRANRAILWLSYLAGFSCIAYISFFWISELRWFVTEYWERHVELGRDPYQFVYQRVVLIVANVIAVLVVPVLVHPYVARWTLGSGSPWWYLVRVAILYFAAVVLAQIWIWVLTAVEPESYIGFAVQTLVQTMLMCELIIVGVLVSITLAWALVLLLMITCVAAGRFVLLRIAESSKGSVLGVSGLLVGIGAIVKAFL